MTRGFPKLVPAPVLHTCVYDLGRAVILVFLVLISGTTICLHSTWFRNVKAASVPDPQFIATALAQRLGLSWYVRTKAAPLDKGMT